MAAQTPTAPAARRAFLSQVAHDSDRDECVRIANYKAGPSPTSHGRATAKSTTSSNLLKKVNRVAFTELFDDDTMMLRRFQFELLRVLRANPRGNGRKARAARETQVGPPTERNEVPSWDSLEPGVHGPRGRRGAAVRVGVFSTRHTRPGQSTAGWAACANVSPKPREPAGRIVRGLRLSR